MEFTINRFKADSRKIWHWGRRLMFKIFSLLLFCLPVREVNLSEIKKVLIVIVGKYGLGDVVLCTPAIRAVKEKFQTEEVSVLINKNNLSILRDNPFIDRFWIYDKDNLHRNIILKIKLVKLIRRYHFDLVLDFYTWPGIEAALFAFLSGARQRVGRNTDYRGFLFTQKSNPSHPQQHQIDRYTEIIESIGIKAERRHPDFFLSLESETKIEMLLKDLNIHQSGSFVVIHPGTASYVADARKWPKQRYSRLADLIIKNLGKNVVFTGSTSEISLVETILSKMEYPAYSVAGRISIPELAALIKRCKVFISANTGPMHIAVAVGSPTVSIFSHFDPDDHPNRWKPRGANNIIIQKNVGCLHCDRRKCQSFRCLDAITVEDVFDGVVNIIEKNPKIHQNMIGLN